MSDRKPSRPRRSSGGRHVAQRPEPTTLPRALRTSVPAALRLARVPARVAQGGVALGLVLSMGAVVVTAQAEAPTAAVAGEQPLALAAGAGTGNPVQLRADAVDEALAAVDEVWRVRADATQVAVPDEVLAELDAATAELQAVLAEVDVESLPREPNVSRSAERAADEAPEPAAAADPTATAVPTSPAAEPEAAATRTPEADVLEGSALPDSSDPATAPLREALDRVRQAAQVVLTTTEQKRAEAEAAQVAAGVAAAQAAAEAERVAAEKAAQRAAWKASLRGYANGQVPSSALCGLSFDAAAQLRCDAAESLEALNAAFRERFGTHLTVSDSYRSYAGQVACRAAKGSLCAAPGTSNHGMGVAVDLGGAVQTFGTAQHQWMRENAPAFQWTLPEWARANGSKPEPWHWEYVG
ncbi:M15 family metallopeptidase [Cellulomonas flavigena]|uniref:M15 family metallopeptidase n=1 Tax=Cellulomonas flavigena TaxID=1711 RepID=UPI0011D2BFFB|nr:M15 family metallopeptidase [Cellulomonas flavigena]